MTSRLAIALAALLIALPPSPALTEEGRPAQTAVAQPEKAVRYELGPQDTLRVRVFEWRASIDQVYAWEALNEKYVIGPSGQLALPLVGEIPAAGLTTAELAARISEKLRERMGLASPPDASVEIIEYRPFFVGGHVEKPGEYPYRPGLTVLQAVSVGGGLLRPRDLAAFRLHRDSIASRGELAIVLAERDRLLIRAARLQAELADAPDFHLPQALSARARDPSIIEMLEQERRIHAARRRAFETQIRTLKELRGFLDQEVDSLNAQRATHQSQVKLVKEELNRIRGLAGRGLTTSARQLELERLMTQLEGDGLKLDAGLIKTRQEISRTDLSVIELENKRSGDVAVELQKTRDEILTAERKRETAAKLIYEAEVIAPDLIMQDEMRAAASQVRYTIIRRTGGKPVEIVADETAAVLPGDTVKVEAAPRGVAGTRNADPAPRSSGLEAAPPPAGAPQLAQTSGVRSD